MRNIKRKTWVTVIAVLMALVTLGTALSLAAFAEEGDAGSEGYSWAYVDTSCCMGSSGAIGYRFSVVSEGGSLHGCEDIMLSSHSNYLYGSCESKVSVSSVGDLYESDILCGYSTYAQVDAQCNFSDGSRFNSSPSSVLSTDIKNSWLHDHTENGNAGKLAYYITGSYDLEGEYILCEPIYSVWYNGHEHALTVAQMAQVQLAVYHMVTGFPEAKCLNWSHYIGNTPGVNPEDNTVQGQAFDAIIGAMSVDLPRGYGADHAYFGYSARTSIPSSAVNSPATNFGAMGGVGVYIPGDDNTGKREIKITVKVDGAEYSGTDLTPQLVVDDVQKTLKKTGGVYTYTCEGKDNNYEVRALEVQGGTSYTVFQSSKAIGDKNEVTIDYYTIAGGLNDDGISNVIVSTGGKSGSTD